MTLWDYKLLLLVKAGFEAASAARCPRVVLQLRVDERVEDAGSSFSRPNTRAGACSSFPLYDSATLGARHDERQV